MFSLSTASDRVRAGTPLPWFAERAAPLAMHAGSETVLANVVGVMPMRMSGIGRVKMPVNKVNKVNKEELY